MYDRFVTLLAERAGRLRLGNGLRVETHVGPVINESQGRKVLDYIDIGVKEGARLLSGGRRLTEGVLAGMLRS